MYIELSDGYISLAFKIKLVLLTEFPVSGIGYCQLFHEKEVNITFIIMRVDILKNIPQRQSFVFASDDKCDIY